MRIKNVKIKNFRALRELSMDFSNMTVIIGENDCGKTSVMLALQKFFEAKKLDDPAEFFKKGVSAPVEITVRFHEVGGKLGQYGIIDADEVIVRRTFQFREKVKSAYLVDGDWKNTDAKFDKLLPEFVLVPAGRNLEIQGKMTSTSLFGKLFRPLVGQIVSQEAAGPVEELKKQIRAGVAVRITDLREMLREQLNNEGLELSHEVMVDPVKGVEIPIQMSDERVEEIPLENRGAGVQNSFILALFRIYAKYETPDFVFAIEEPENNLHPRAQREMRWAMQEFSRRSQVICTTHSPVFLDLGKLEDNVVLRRREDGATEVSLFALKDPNELRELVGIKVSDALLSGGGNCTLIVEGDTELHAYPHLFRCIGINSRSLGISIMSIGGPNVKNMLRYAKVLQAYNLPCIIVVDKNKLDDARKVEAEKMPNVKLVHALGKGNFEEYLPVDIIVEVINDLCRREVAERGQEEVQEISKFDIDSSKPIENQLRQLVHDRYFGVRFNLLKVQLGEEVGKRMAERGLKPDDEIVEIMRIAEKITKG